MDFNLKNRILTYEETEVVVVILNFYKPTIVPKMS